MRLATVPSEERGDTGGPGADVREPAAAAQAESLPGGVRVPVRGDAGSASAAGGRAAARTGGDRSSRRRTTTAEQQVILARQRACHLVEERPHVLVAMPLAGRVRFGRWSPGRAVTSRHSGDDAVAQATLRTPADDGGRRGGDPYAGGGIGHGLPSRLDRATARGRRRRRGMVAGATNESDRPTTPDRYARTP
jgi:hypothetical protein